MRYSGNDYYCDVVLKDTSLFKIEYESDSVFAYHHTNPYWPVHIVVIPKKHIPSFTNRNSEDDIIILEMLEVIRKIATKIEREVGAARILTNLGEYQESKHLHFHISSGEPLK
jgi:histidine triad (HIT) family protein